MADGRAGCCRQYGILRTGGPCHRGERLRAGPTGAATVAGMLHDIQPDYLADGTLRQHSTALLAGRDGGDCPRCHTLFRHHRRVRLLFPDDGTGRFDAEMFGQHEDTLGPEHTGLRHGCRLQLPVYLHHRHGGSGCSCRNRRGRADNRLPDALFPAGAVGHAAPEGTEGVVPSTKRCGGQRWL